MSVAINNSIDTGKESGMPWYRYGWPWFLISIPMVSVVLGCVMLYLAFNANNSLVVDDYYKEGKAINLRIERDRAAALLGLQARLSTTSEGIIVEMDRQRADLPDALQVDADRLDLVFAWPDELEMRWVHVTQESRDGAALLQYIGGQRYIAADRELPVEGKYRVHLQPPESVSWRLVSTLTGFADSQSRSQIIGAPLPDEVYNSSFFDE